LLWKCELSKNPLLYWEN